MMSTTRTQWHTESTPRRGARWLPRLWQGFQAWRRHRARRQRLVAELMSLSERELLDLAIGRGELPGLLRNEIDAVSGQRQASALDVGPRGWD